MAKAAPSFESILQDARSTRFDPIYFLYGDEPFLTEELEREITANAIEPHARDFNYDLVYGAEANAKEVLGLCAGYPIMAERRVVVVRDFDKLKENREFQGYAQSPNPTCVVVLTCSGKPNLNTHPYRALRQHSVSFEAKPLRDRDMPRWIDARIQRSGYKAEPQALQMLSEFLGTDLRTVAQEIDKLQTFVGERAEISADDVVRASGQTRDVSVFELQRMVGQGRYHAAVRTGERLLQQASNVQGESLIIIAILTAFFMKLWRLVPLAGGPEREIASIVGVNPYFVGEYQSALKVYGVSGVERALHALLAADFESKGGANHDPRVIMTMLLRRIMPGA